MLYKAASRIIDHVQNKHGTIKSLVHSSGYQNIKQLYALICETFKYSGIIEQILVSTRFLEQEKWLEKSLAKVLLYEMLFGRGIQCGGKYRLAFKRHKSAFNAALVRMKIKMGVVNHKDLLPKLLQDEVMLPRYVRVNTLKCTVQDVINQFLNEGYECILTREQAVMKANAAENADEISRLFADYVTGLKPCQFMCDIHLEDLLVFPPATDFHNHQLYKAGVIILQDKASCLPAYMLAPPPGSHVIDACAAPGNKTSHLAAIMKNTGKVFAFDLDSKRVATLSKLTELSGATNIEIHNQDFLTVNPRNKTFSNVRHILLDPSCSGSGIVSRLDHLTNDSQSNSTERLEALARVQVRLLSHALSFPYVERVVYSTCSVHSIENEHVVMEVLATNPGFELTYACPMWRNRGIVVTQEHASSKATIEAATPCMSACLRAVPKDDYTNGFFVALFQRRGIPPKQEWTCDNLEEVKSRTKPKRKKRKCKSQTKQGSDILNKTPEAYCRHPDGDQTASVSHIHPVKGKQSKKRKRDRRGAVTDEPKMKMLRTEEAVRLGSSPHSCDGRSTRTDCTKEQNRENPKKKKRKKKRTAAHPVTW